MIIGATLAAAAGAVVAADQLDSPRWQGVALAVVAGLVLCLRGRFYADITQAGTLIGGGSLTLIAVATGLGLGSRSAVIPAAGALLHTGPAFHMSETPRGALRPAPSLGQDNDDIFGHLLSLDEAEVKSLRAEGVI